MHYNRRRDTVIRASRILVPVNGNPTDQEAVALACEIARRAKSAVYAIYVIEVKRTLPLDVDDLLSQSPLEEVPAMPGAATLGHKFPGGATSFGRFAISRSRGSG